VEGVRRDVTVINLSVATLENSVGLFRRLDPALPLSLSASARRALEATRWPDTSISVPLVATANARGDDTYQRAGPPTTFDVEPQFGDRMGPADVTMLDIVQTNRWRRPLTFSMTAGRLPVRWLEAYSRHDGLFWSIVPSRDPAPDVAILRRLNGLEFRGFADTSVVLGLQERTFGYLYHAAFAPLLAAERSVDRAACIATLERLLAAVPPDRIDLPPEARERSTTACDGAAISATSVSTSSTRHHEAPR
jgi:hypothetical protein